VAATPSFVKQGSKTEVEEGLQFQPRFDSQGLIPAIVSDWESGEVVMFAWMNATALQATITSGQAHFWSRSRKVQWRKGEESGNTLRVREMRTDCDQDVVWLRVTVEGDGLGCHTNRTTCFYRILKTGSDQDEQNLTFVASADP